MKYIPDRFLDAINAKLSELRSYELQGTNVQEERTKKKKKQKESKKKEDNSLSPRVKRENDSEKKTKKEIAKCYGDDDIFVIPMADEVQAYLNEQGITEFTGQYFVDFYNSRNWQTAKGITITDWKAKALNWKCYRNEFDKTNKTASNAKRQTNSANASGTQTNRGEEVQLQPVKTRHEQLAGILQQEHYVPQSVGQELEGVVAEALSTHSGDGLSLEEVIGKFGHHAVIVWLSEVFEAALVRLEVPDERFCARQVVQVAEGLLRVLDVYKGLTARQVLRAMERVQKIEKGDDIMAAVYAEWKG